MLNKLIFLFKAKNLVHLIKIFIIFGLAGSLSVFLSDPILKIIKLDEIISFYPVYILIRLIIIFPLYQLILFAIAFIFGEYAYFKKFFQKFFNYFRYR